MKNPKNAQRKIELLAPAKDKTCAFTAINCGADAVYIGAPDFGARKNATNSIEDIEEIINYAHKFGVKVFVTVNTLIFDNELEAVKKLIHKLYEIKTDAIIVQDMAILEMAKRGEIPPICLHASTQCHNSDLKKVQFLEKIGFSRAILARELSIEEIKNISKNTEIELETFVQGALCVSYSGQCYMSYTIGGRSANRGECAQPCRKKYSLVDNNGKILAKDKHLLCLKDFNASDCLKDLIDAGVTSFKIEGRLKDENYIKNTVSFYRKKLDEILAEKGLERASYGICTPDFEPNLKKTFNRGFCEYFLNGRKKDITAFDSPKNIGEPAGVVKEVRKTCFSLSEGQLNVNDGITFFDESGNKELLGTKIEKVSQENRETFYYPNSIKNLKKGTKIYKNMDFEYLKQLEKFKPVRKIPVNIEFLANEKEIKIKISDLMGNESELVIKNDYELANNQEKAKENLEKQLQKLGSTEFVAEEISIISNSLPFIKINEINDMRHKIVSIFQENRIKNYKIKKQQGINYEKSPQNELDYKSNITNKLAKTFYENCEAKVAEYGLEHPSQTDFKGKTVMTTKHCLRYSLGFCSKTGKKVNEPLFLVDETGKKYPIEFDCKNCRMMIKY